MSLCDNIHVRAVRDGKVYLDGGIYGLDSKKQYCLKYERDGKWINVPNARLNYTYIVNLPSCDIGGERGGYIPLDSRYTTYVVRLVEVERGRCENEVRTICTKYLSTDVRPKPIPTPAPTPIKGEHAIITNVRYPGTASPGDEIEVIVTAQNVGTEPCELRAVLRNYEDKKIDTMPEERYKLFTNVPVGQTRDFKLSTRHVLFDQRWRMPEYNWDLKVQIAEINKGWGSVQKVHDEKNITVQLYVEGAVFVPEEPWVPSEPHDVVPPGYIPDAPGVVDVVTGTGVAKLTMDAPSLMMTGETDITGKAPSANTRVEIMGVRKLVGFDMLATDSTLAYANSGPDGKYSASIELDEFGIIEVYAKIRKDWKPSGWLSGFGIPSIDWLARDTVSGKKTIFVLTYPILLAVLALIAMVADKKYGFIGIFKKKR